MKIVRDNIPDIINNNGAKDKFVISSCKSKKERYGYLLAKVKEETEELLENPSIEEIADVLEVTYALANELGFTTSDVEFYRERKKIEFGGFRKGYLLQKSENNLE